MAESSNDIQEITGLIILSLMALLAIALIVLMLVNKYHGRDDLDGIL